MIGAVAGGACALVAIGCGSKPPRVAAGSAGSGSASAGSGNGSVGSGNGSAGSGSASPGAPIAAMPTGWADADLVILDHGAIVFVRVGDTVSEVARLTLPGADPEMFAFDGAWIDRDTLAVTRGDGDVLRLDKDGVVPLPFPDAATFTSPRPAVDDPALEATTSFGRLAIRGGEVWWSQCTWALPYDGGVCEAWVNARLWPSAARAEATAPLATPTYAWPTIAPKGYTAATGEDNVSCRAPWAHKAQVFTGDAAADEHVDEFHWISADPARLLVVYGQAGYASLIPDRWALYDGCKPEPLASGGLVDVGPGDLWVGTSRAEDDGEVPITLTVFRGAKAIGSIPIGKYASVRFRPR